MKRFIALSLTLLLVLSLTVGCAKPAEYPTTDSGYTEEARDEAPKEPAPNSAKGTGGESVTNPNDPEKLIITVNMRFETTEFKASMDALNKLISDNKGYMSNSNISYGSTYDYGKMYQRGEFTVRIPKQSFNSFKENLGGIGSLVNETTSRDDVTKYYRDTEARLKVVEVKETRLLALLEKAEKLEDIIALENQLTDVIYEKENLKAQLLGLDDQIEYTTFYMTINEVAKYTPIEDVKTSFSQKVANAFSGSWKSFISVMGTFIILLIYNLPLLIFLAIVIAITVMIIRRIKRNKKLKKTDTK